MDEAVLHKHPRGEKMRRIGARNMTHDHEMHGTIQQMGGVDEVAAFRRGLGDRRSINDVRRPAVSHS